MASIFCFTFSPCYSYMRITSSPLQPFAHFDKRVFAIKDVLRCYQTSTVWKGSCVNADLESPHVLGLVFTWYAPYQQPQAAVSLEP